MGHIKAADVPENEAFGRPSEAQPHVTEDIERDSEMEGSKSVSFAVNSNSVNGTESVQKDKNGVQDEFQADGAAPGETLHTIPVWGSSQQLDR